MLLTRNVFKFILSTNPFISKTSKVSTFPGYPSSVSIAGCTKEPLNQASDLEWMIMEWGWCHLVFCRQIGASPEVPSQLGIQLWSRLGELSHWSHHVEPYDRNPGNKTIRAHPSQRQMRHKHKCVVCICWHPTATLRASSLSLMPQEVIGREWSQSPACWDVTARHLAWSCFSVRGWNRSEDVSCSNDWSHFDWELESLLWCWSQVPPATLPIVSPCLGLDGYQAFLGGVTRVRGCPRLMPKRHEDIYIYMYTVLHTHIYIYTHTYIYIYSFIHSFWRLI